MTSILKRDSCPALPRLPIKRIGRSLHFALEQICRLCGAKRVGNRQDSAISRELFHRPRCGRPVKACGLAWVLAPPAPAMKAWNSAASFPVNLLSTRAVIMCAFADCSALFSLASMNTSLAIAACAVVGAAALFRIRKRTEGTTLVAPWCWKAASLLLLCATLRWIGSEAPAAWHSHVLFAAAATTFWPLMAILGAKRPQDRGWQLIVVSLWFVQLVPVGQSLLQSSDAALELAPAWSAFLLGLIGLGLLNSLPTRRWPAALIATGGQILLFAVALGWGNADAVPTNQALSVAGLALLVVALVIDAWRPPRRRPAQPIDRVWLDFRDSFGLLWSLRVAERFNSAARQLRWGVRLRWSGLDVDPQQPAVEVAPETSAAMRQNLDTLLRRFVSPEWLESRWQDRLE